MSAALALARPLVPYVRPAVDLDGRDTVEDRAAWVIVLGFVALAVVSVYAFYCSSIGGSFYASFSWSSGFTVACYQ
jgi:hypothetical protein